MTQEERDATIQRYEERLVQYGQSAQALGWRDQKQQWLRFDILSQIAPLQGAKILDVGCGFGDFYLYLKERGIQVEYVGYDIVPSLLDIAMEQHPDARFELCDITIEAPTEKFDYVFSSGILNHKIEDNMAFARTLITKCFEHATKGAAINMMTSYVDFRDEYLYYYSPEEIFSFVKSLTRFVTVRHDYALYEFTLHLYHEKGVIHS